MKIFTKKIEPEAFVANSYLSFYEFIKIYLNVIYNLFLTLKFLNKNKNLFFIKKINYKNVLKPLIINSFSGSIQNSLIQALSIRNFLQKSKIKNFICYGEFNPGYRSIYFFTKKLDYPVNITTIHHGYANENLLFFFHKKDEFNLNYKQGEMSSPMPDQYLVQGIQYKKILKKYYPKKIKIIGCLKYDITKFKAPIKKNKNKYKKRILIAPSIGDEKDILNYLIYFVKNNRSLVKNFKFYLSPHPVNKLKTINYFKKNLSTIEINTSNKSTQEIMQFCDLVLCGFSTVAYEASIMGIPAMRLVNPNSPILFHLKDDIKKIYDQKVFEKELKRKKYNKIKRNKIIKYFFYKIDGMTYKRFWKELK